MNDTALPDNTAPSAWDRQRRINERIHDVAWKGTGQDESDRQVDAERWADAWAWARRAILGEEIRECASFEQLRDLMAEIAEGEYDNLHGIY